MCAFQSGLYRLSTSLTALPVDRGPLPRATPRLTCAAPCTDLHTFGGRSVFRDTLIDGVLITGTCALPYLSVSVFITGTCVLLYLSHMLYLSVSDSVLITGTCVQLHLSVGDSVLTSGTRSLFYLFAALTVHRCQ